MRQRWQSDVNMNKDQLKIIPEDIKLVKIIPLKESIDYEFDLQYKIIKVNLAQETMHNLQKKSIKITLTIIIEADNHKIAYFLYDFIFTIDHLEHFIVNQEKKVFSGELIATLISIAYSTARGIIHLKCIESTLKEFILPVINPNDLLLQTNN